MRSRADVDCLFTGTPGTLTVSASLSVMAATTGDTSNNDRLSVISILSIMSVIHICLDFPKMYFGYCQYFQHDQNFPVWSF